MSCNVKGTGCRLCPGMWLAGILLLLALFQSLFSANSTSQRSAQDEPSTDVPAESAQSASSVPGT